MAGFIDFFVTLGTIMLVGGGLLWALKFLLTGGVSWKVEQPARRRPIFRCAAGHGHHTEKAMDECPPSKQWVEDYLAGIVDYDGNLIRQRNPGDPCPRCKRNHFSKECPPPGYRVTDSRTGEVIGHWTPLKERERT